MGSMNTTIIEREKISLNTPIFVEGLPGIGLIGKIAVECLISELEAKKFAELYSPHFPHQAVVLPDSKLRLVRNEFYYHKGNQDFIFLTGDTQVPPTDSYGHYAVVQEILDFLADYEVKEIYTLGGYSTGGKEVEEPKVLGSGTSAALLEKISGIDPLLVLREDIGAAIVGASGLLLAEGKLRNLEGVCLLGESSGSVIDPKAAKAVIHSLSKILGIEITLDVLESRIKESERMINELQELQEQAAEKEKMRERRKDMEYIR